MTKIVLIGVILLLVWIRIMMPFIRERLLDRKEFETCPIQSKFNVLLSELDKIVFGGEAVMTVYEEQPEYIYIEGPAGHKVKYCMMYSTGSLTVQIILDVEGEQKIVNRQYYGLRDTEAYIQKNLARTIFGDTQASCIQCNIDILSDSRQS